MYHAIVFLPLLGFLIAGLFGGSIGAKASEYVTSGFLVIAAVLSWIAFFTVGFGDTEVFTVPVMRFIQAGGLSVDWAFRIDTLTVVMLVVVNTVSALVHIYSIGYMHHDPHRPRFFAFLSLFTFAMLALVTADNLVQMFFGWEGVGLASYLLIGFWYKKPSASAAAIKAFVVNRIGDFGFALGIFAVFMMMGTIDLDTIFAQAPTLTGKTINFFGWHADALTLNTQAATRSVRSRRQERIYVPALIAKEDNTGPRVRPTTSGLTAPHRGGPSPSDHEAEGLRNRACREEALL